MTLPTVDALMARVSQEAQTAGANAFRRNADAADADAAERRVYAAWLRRVAEALVPFAENADSFHDFSAGRGVGLICDGQPVNDPAFVVGDLRHAAALLRGEKEEERR